MKEEIPEQFEPQEMPRIQEEAPDRERLIGVAENTAQQYKIKEALMRGDMSILGKTVEEITEKSGIISSTREEFLKRVANGEFGNTELTTLLEHIKAPVSKASDEEYAQATREKEVIELHAHIANYTGEYLDMPKLVARLLAKKEIGTPLSAEELDNFLAMYPEPSMIEHRIAYALMQNEARKDIPEAMKNEFPNFLRLTLQTLYGKRMEYLEQFRIMQSEAEERYPADAVPKEERGEKSGGEDKKEILHEGLRFKSTGESINSPTHPESNQDRILNNPGEGLYGVFDGVGGEAGGEKASSVAQATVEEYIKTHKADVQTLDQAKELVRNAIEAAHTAVLRAKEENPDFENMATTATVGFVFQGQMVTGQVGDSRLYRGWRDGDGKGILKQESVDDSVIPKELRAKFAEVKNPQEELTPSELEIWEKRNVVTNAVGNAQSFARMGVQVNVIDITPGDQFLFASDGLTDPATDRELAEALFPDMKKENEKKSPQELLAEAAQRAHEGAPSDTNRAKHDDLSYVLVSAAEQVPAKKNSVMPISEAKARVQASTEKRAERATILGAQSFAELYDSITWEGGLQGSGRFFTAAELKEVIDQVRKGERDISYVTRTDGLREKVEALLKNGAVEKEVTAEKNPKWKEALDAGGEALLAEVAEIGSLKNRQNDFMVRRIEQVLQSFKNEGVPVDEHILYNERFIRRRIDDPVLDTIIAHGQIGGAQRYPLDLYALENILGRPLDQRKITKHPYAPEYYIRQPGDYEMKADPMHRITKVGT